MLAIIVLAFLQLLSLDAIAGSRLEAISGGMIAAASGNAEQLQTLGIYGSAVLVLLVLLNMVREQAGRKRLISLLAIQLLCNAMLIYYLA